MQVPLIISCRSLRLSWETWLKIRPALPGLRPQKAASELPTNPPPRQSAELQQISTGARDSILRAEARKSLPQATAVGKNTGEPRRGEGGLWGADEGSRPCGEARRVPPSHGAGVRWHKGGDGLADAVVAVTCGGGWASGVLLHESGVVLTVAHALGGGGGVDRGDHANQNNKTGAKIFPPEDGTALSGWWGKSGWRGEEEPPASLSTAARGGPLPGSRVTDAVGGGASGGGPARQLALSAAAREDCQGGASDLYPARSPFSHPHPPRTCHSFQRVSHPQRGL